MATGGVYPKVTGDIVFQSDYNSIQSDTNLVVNTYYQNTMASSQVTTGVGSIISEGQMDNLLTDINKAYKHITGSNTSLSDVTAGSIVDHTDWNAYKVAVDYCLANYLTAHPSQLTSSTVNSGITAAWNGSRTWTRRFTWANSSLATAFFITGGYIVVDLSGSNSSGSVKDNDWQTILNTIATQTYGFGNWNSGIDIDTYEYSSGATYYGANYARIYIHKVDTVTLDVSITVNDADGTHIDGFGQTVPDYDVTTDVAASITHYYSYDAISAPVTTITTTSNF